MDFGLKIGAVFSLADGENNGEPDNKSGDSGKNDDLEDNSEFLLPDRDDSFEIDIMSSPSTGTSMPLSDHLSYSADQESPKWNTSPNESTSIVEDPDVPPSLLLENSSSQEFQSPSLISTFESMSPPILHPEEPVKVDVPIVRKRCTKIAPCYIVLTNIDQIMHAKSSVSSRTFKRSFVECSNMCKKVMFKRNLKAGKDVFNVKTPSKQKDYLIYLLKLEKERSKKHRKKTPQLRDIIERHHLKLEARKNAVGKPAQPRIRRTVSRLPNDFATRPVSPNTSEVGEADENKQDLNAEELARLHNAFMKRKHKAELNSLKRLITIKRSLNLNLKRSKRNKSEGYENFLKSDVTSSVSGRVRKVNPKYIGDFAVCRKDIDEKRLVAVAQAQLKRAESASKKKVEEINKSNDYLQRKRKTFTDSLSTDKKMKLADVVIDNPEKGDVRSFLIEQKKSKKKVSKSRTKSHPLDVSVNVPQIGSHGTVFTFNDRSKSLKQNKNQTENKDGVLIQDMPREENVISGFLQNISCEDNGTDVPTTSDAEGYITSANKKSDQYVYAKQLLKNSLEKRISQSGQLKIRQISPPIKREVQASDMLTHEHAGAQDKYKMLKIPENVQKLFTNKEIKQEPLDDGYETTSTSPTVVSDSKVVTVAYSNGIYKKVLLSSPGQASSTPVTIKAGMAQGPILVNTNQGLRYLVPKSALAKHTLPSYNEAIKAKFVPVNSNLKSSALMASQPSVSINNTTGVLNMSSVVQTGNPVLATQLVSQTYPEQQGMSKVLSVLPSVVQVPVQNVINTSNATSLLRQTLTPPILKLGNACLNKSLQPPVVGLNTPVSTTTTQTQTVVHKVSPALLKQSTLSQSEKSSNNTSNLQQSVSLANAIGNGIQVTAGAQNQKNVDKSKFYLLKIDGKNVLIPIEGDKAQPKAYVVNSDIIGTTNTQSQNTEFTEAFLSAAMNTSSAVRPTVVAVPTSGGITQSKPTLAVVPNMKQVHSVLPTQLPFVPSTTISSQNRSILQTVTLTNIAQHVCGVGNMAVISAVNSTIASSSVATSTKTTNACTSVVKSGSYKLTTQPVSTPSSLSQSNIQPVKVPVYLKLAETSSVSSSLKPTVSTCSTKSAFSAVKTPVFVRPAGQNKIKTQPFGVLSDILSKKSQPSAKLPLPPLSGLKNVKEHDYIKGVDNKNLDKPVTQNSGGLCEKSGVFLPEKVIEVDEKPQAFKEAVTAREERLRRLKELLKEKQKAVEDIRSNKPT